MLIDSQFERVAQKFFNLTAAQPHGGAALAIYYQGQPVIDIWAGQSRPGVAWQEQTNSVVFSSTKGLLSILVHRAIEQGLIDPDEPVCTYWPEFGCNGKEQITVAMIMRHRAGLNAPTKDLTFADLQRLEPVERAFAAQSPLWEPDSTFAYHALSIGHLLGKILFNVTGKRVNQLLQDEIVKPLGAPAWIGIPASEEQNVAHLISDGTGDPIFSEPGTNEYWQERAMTYGSAMLSRVDSFTGGFNDPRIHQAELAGAGGITNARSLAKIYSATVIQTAGVRLLQDESVLKAISRPNPGDSLFGEVQPHPIHSLGFIVSNHDHCPVLSPQTFGHNGLGGQQAFGDLQTKVGFGYVTNWIPLLEDSFIRHRELCSELILAVAGH